MSFVSGCENVSGDQLAWTVTVPAGQTETVSYTVRVKDEAASGAAIAADKATVGGVSHPCPAVYVGKHLTEAEKAAIGQAANSVSSGKTGWALAAELYDGAAHLALQDLLPSPQTVFQSLFAKSSTAGHFYLTNSGPYFAAVAPTMFGGRVVKAGTLFGGVRTRGPILSQLETGDILVCTDNVADEPADGDYVMYLMAGGDAVLCLTGDAPARLTGDEAQAALDTAIAYQKFAVLRPAALRP